MHLPQWFSWRHSRVACVPRYPSWSRTRGGSDWSVARSRGMVIGLRWAGRSERDRGASWKIAKVAEGEERISSYPPGSLLLSVVSLFSLVFSSAPVFSPFPYPLPVLCVSARLHSARYFLPGGKSRPARSAGLRERDVGHGPECSAVCTLPTINVNMEPCDSMN